ncbi:hypothetical protein D3C81_1654470 [compost metagenome]
MELRMEDVLFGRLRRQQAGHGFLGRAIAMLAVAAAIQHAWMGQDDQALAMRGKQQGALVSIVQRIHGHLAAIDAQAAGHAHLRIFQGDLARFLQQTRELAARHGNRKVLERAVGVAPQGHFRRLVQHHAQQLVAPAQLMLISDAAQAALQAQPVFALLVIEQEILAQHVARQRHRQQVARQGRQAFRADQRVGPG